jgi:PAS domain S-box-containing protein
MLTILNNTLNASLQQARASANALQINNEELNKLYDSLELRVEERTQELAKEQLRIQALLEELNEASRIAKLASYELNSQTQTITFNNRFYDLLGIDTPPSSSYEMPIAEVVTQFLHPEDAPRLLNDIETIGTAGMTGDLEYRLQHSDGSFRTFLFRFVVELNETDSPIGVRGAVQDITERKLAEEQLRKFQLALERSTDAVFMTDTEGIIEYVNPAFEKVYGFAAQEAVGENPRLIKSGLIPSEQYADFWEALLNDQIVSGEIVNKRKDGRLIPVDSVNASILDINGTRLGFMATHRDITERKQIEQNLTKLATELETVTQVATIIAGIPDSQEMLQTVVDLTKTRFNLYHAHIYLLDEIGENLVLTAGAGEAGRQMTTQGRTIPLTQERSLVARAARTQLGVIVNDVTLVPDFLPNSLLPDTRAELAVPLIIGNRVLGVLDVQATQANAFTEEDIRVQTILAAQIAVALENARANEKTAKTVAELDTLTRHLTREGWQTYLAETERSRIGFLFENNQLVSLPENGYQVSSSAKTLTQAIELRGEKVGQLVATDSELEEEELNIILQAVSQGLSAHIENLRLTEEAERRVNELGVVNDIGQTLATEVDLHKIIVAVIKQLSEVFNANIVYVALYDQERQMIDIPYMLDHGQEITNEPSFSFGEGVNTTIIKNRQSLFINHDTERRLVELGALPTNDNILAKSFIGVPMIVGDQVIGVLSVQDSEREGRFTEGDVNLLRTISSNVAVAIQNARLFIEVRKRAEREAMVNLIGQKIQGATTVQGALQTAIQELGIALKARRTFVELITQPDATDANGIVASTGR